MGIMPFIIKRGFYKYGEMNPARILLTFPSAKIKLFNVFHLKSELPPPNLGKMLSPGPI